MNLDQLMAWAQDKARFQAPGDSADFCEAYLDFIFDGLQAVIVSQNENHYRFFQYREDGNFNVTRPVNSLLFLSQEDFSQTKGEVSYMPSTSATFAVIEPGGSCSTALSTPVSSPSVLPWTLSPPGKATPPAK